MNTNFRHSHLLALLHGYAKQNLPFDLFYRKYTRAHRSLGSHDRRFIADIAYFLLRWKGFYQHFAANEADWNEILTLQKNFHPKDFIHDSSLPLHVRVSFPKDYFNWIEKQLGTEAAKAFCLISNTTAPTTIRVNTLKTSREALYEEIHKSTPCRKGRETKTSLIFEKRQPLTAMESFKKGLFEVQDEASQIVSLTVKADKGQSILDYCAGSGGKALAIASALEDSVQIFLHDIRKKSLLEAKTRLHRAGVQKANILFPEDLNSLSEGSMDWIIVDAPCSGSGTLRRCVDQKWRFCSTKQQALEKLQRQIVKDAMYFLKPGGFLVYATCSVMPSENQDQVKFFEQSLGLTLVPDPFSSFPQEGKMDGFFAATMQKTLR